MESRLDEMNRRNEEIVAYSTDPETGMLIELFQNRILVQQNSLDEMKHNVKVNPRLHPGAESELEEYAQYFHALELEFHTFSDKF